MSTYHAILFGSFGGPEGPDDVMPFLENVVRGRNVPRERLLEVAEHYKQFDGVSPINAQNRALIAALRAELDRRQIDLPIHFGNRNWEPYFRDALADIQAQGGSRVITFLTSAFSSYSGCRQYRENIADAAEEIGFNNLESHKLRAFFNHPKFIECIHLQIKAAFDQLPGAVRADARLLFTAHSIPLSMARGCAYEAQLQESCRLVAKALGRTRWDLVYQSRSGAPHVPWLEPDICDDIEARGRNWPGVVISPIGFLTDHMEVLADLDDEARKACEAIDLPMVRAATPGAHPLFVELIADLIEERLHDAPERPALGRMGAGHDHCPDHCCQIVRG